MTTLITIGIVWLLLFILVFGNARRHTVGPDGTCQLCRSKPADYNKHFCRDCGGNATTRRMKPQ